MYKAFCIALLMVASANAVERKRQPSEEEHLRRRAISSAFFEELLEEDAVEFRGLSDGSMSMRFRNLEGMSMSM